MLQSSFVRKAFPDTDYILLNTSQSSYSKLSEEKIAKSPSEEVVSINYTINSPLSTEFKPNILESLKKTLKIKASLSLNESFKDSIVDSRLNMVDLSAIECKFIFGLIRRLWRFTCFLFIISCFFLVKLFFLCTLKC